MARPLSFDGDAFAGGLSLGPTQPLLPEVQAELQHLRAREQFLVDHANQLQASLQQRNEEVQRQHVRLLELSATAEEARANEQACQQRVLELEAHLRRAAAENET